MSADVDLLRRWASGDAGAGRELVERHFESVYRFFRGKIDRGCDDLTQQVFATCVAEPERFRGEGSLRSYLLAVARHTLFNHFRGQRREARALQIGEHSAFEMTRSPSSGLALRGEVRLLREALRRLPLDLQIVLELHYWEEATTAEIARVVEIPVGTVKTRLARARRSLRAQIESAREEPGLLKSTLEGLDTWAQELRSQLAPER